MSLFLQFLLHCAFAVPDEIFRLTLLRASTDIIDIVPRSAACPELPVITNKSRQIHTAVTSFIILIQRKEKEKKSVISCHNYFFTATNSFHLMIFGKHVLYIFVLIDVTVHTGLCIYCTDRKKMIQE